MIFWGCPGSSFLFAGSEDVLSSERAIDSDVSSATFGRRATSDGSSFAYNVDGDMVTRNLAGQSAQSLAWNDDHRLASVKEGANVVAEFIYGLDETRVRRKTGDTYTYYHVDGTEYEWDNASQTGVFTYYHQMAGRTVAFTKSDTGVTTWMHADQVNSTSVTRDQTGTAKTQRYTPWGELRTDGALGTDHHFTGQVSDQSTGLAFYNARYYDPAIGRFVSPDTIVPNAGDGQFLNRYSYVNNRPIVWNDPTGHCPPNVRHAKGCASVYDPRPMDTPREELRPTVPEAEAKQARLFHEYIDAKVHAAMWAPVHDEAIRRFVGESTSEEIIENYVQCEGAVRLTQMSCEGVLLLSDLSLPNITWKNVYTVGATVVAVGCAFASGGACVPVMIAIAATNVTISAVENQVVVVEDGDVKLFQGSKCENIGFGISVATNVIPLAMSSAVRADPTAPADVVAASGAFNAGSAIYDGAYSLAGEC